MDDNLRDIYNRLSRRPLASAAAIHALLHRLSTGQCSASTNINTCNQNRSMPHFLTTLSGCRITRWLLPIIGPRPYRRDCYNEMTLHPSKILNIHSDNDTHQIHQQLSPMDTIYITYDQVVDFVKMVLPHIRCPILLISGQRENIPPPPSWAIQEIIFHSNIRFWFLQNLPIYAGHKGGGVQGHSKKLASFPYGLKQRVRDDPLTPTHGEAYQAVFLQSLQDDYGMVVGHTRATAGSASNEAAAPYVPPLRRTRSTYFYQGYVNVASNVQHRQSNNNNGTFLAPLEYYRKIADSDYLWSPNGDRPECYRHYEALGLGTAPVTQWSRQSHCYVHLEVTTGCVFQDDDDDELYHVPVDEPPTHHYPQQSPRRVGASRADPLVEFVVNRNAVLEEFWMDYIDVYTNQSWTWWNRYSFGTNDEGPITTLELLGNQLAGLAPEVADSKDDDWD